MTPKAMKSFRNKAHAAKNARINKAAHSTYSKYGNRVHHKVQKQCDS